MEKYKEQGRGKISLISIVMAIIAAVLLISFTIAMYHTACKASDNELEIRHLKQELQSIQKKLTMMAPATSFSDGLEKLVAHER